MSEENKPEELANLDFQISQMKSLAIYSNELFGVLKGAGFTEQQALFIASQVVIAGAENFLYPVPVLDSDDSDDFPDDDDDGIYN